MEFLQNCRPFAVSMTNALKFIKLMISQDKSDNIESEVKVHLFDKIELKLIISSFTEKETSD